VEWWPAPQFDDPSIFARILDPEGGHFSITGRDIQSVERAYVDGSLVLRTEVVTGSGRYRLTEALVMAEGARNHDLGKESPHALVRYVEVLDGEVTLDIEFAPRFEYGLSLPVLHSHSQSMVARGGTTSLLVSSNIDLEDHHSKASATVTLEAGADFAVTAEAFSSWGDIPEPWDPDRASARLDDTVEAWRTWGAHHQNYEGPYADLVSHSGRVLQGLTYTPTGAIVAAPTTSLPETIGGDRNWDYRYCWIRDAGYTLRALWVAACPDEAFMYLDYLTTSAGAMHEEKDIQIMFGIRGERDLSERTIPWLRGWRDSSPVRVGNGAWNQTQLDAYGELLSATHRLREQFGELDEYEKTFLASLADRATTIWREADHGIWEIRDEPKHYLYSKLMCWVAVDRAIDMADQLEAESKVPAWEKAREEIREAILDEGWSDEAGAFTQAFGSDDLDASSLVIPLVGFLPFDDERVISTIHAIGEGLTDQRGLVYRYLAHDGLEGEEGTFLLCTFWLVQGLAGIGEIDAAKELFELAISFRNDVDLLSEEVDSESGEMIGNFPQAFSHVGLVNAAWAISRAIEGKDQHSAAVGDR
jgi:GH15 family glucan-1,4-alpha-glucosidase